MIYLPRPSSIGLICMGKTKMSCAFENGNEKLLLRRIIKLANDIGQSLPGLTPYWSYDICQSIRDSIQTDMKRSLSLITYHET